MRVSSTADLAGLSTLLGTPPSSQSRQGDLVSPRNPRSQRFQENIWLLESGLSDELDLADHIAHLLAVLDAAGSHYEEVLRIADSIAIRCLFSSDTGQGSVTLDEQMLGRLSERKITLSIDLFPPSAEEVAGA